MLIFKAEFYDKTYQNDSVSMSIDDASISSCVFASDQVRDAKRFAKLILKIKETKNVGIFLLWGIYLRESGYLTI